MIVQMKENYKMQNRNMTSVFLPHNVRPGPQLRRKRSGSSDFRSKKKIQKCHSVERKLTGVSYYCEARVNTASEAC